MGLPSLRHTWLSVAGLFGCARAPPPTSTHARAQKNDAAEVSPLSGRAPGEGGGAPPSGGLCVRGAAGPPGRPPRRRACPTRMVTDWHWNVKDSILLIKSTTKS